MTSEHQSPSFLFDFLILAHSLSPLRPHWLHSCHWETPASSHWTVCALIPSLSHALLKMPFTSVTPSPLSVLLSNVISQWGYFSLHCLRLLALRPPYSLLCFIPLPSFLPPCLPLPPLLSPSLLLSLLAIYNSVDMTANKSCQSKIGLFLWLDYSFIWHLFCEIF